MRRGLGLAAVVAAAVATAPPAERAQHHSVRLAQLNREIERKTSSYNYREDPPPGAAHAPYEDGLRTRCSLRVFRSRALYARYCPLAPPSESARLSDMLRRAKESCRSMRSGQQIESMLRATLSHPALGRNVSCVRELLAHNDRIARASLESLQRLQALYHTHYPNRPTRPSLSPP